MHLSIIRDPITVIYYVLQYRSILVPCLQWLQTIFLVQLGLHTGMLAVWYLFLLMTIIVMKVSDVNMT